MADTRQLILDAAWDLFADRGFESVSVRDVTRAAGVNLASVSYHFGGKDGLIQETVKLCLNPIYEYGIKLLQDAEAEHGGVENIPLKQLMECWIRPMLLSEECGVRYDLVLRLLARFLIELDYTMPRDSQVLMKEIYSQYTKAFKVHYPHLSDDMIVKHIIFVRGAAFYGSGLGFGVTQILKGEEVTLSKVNRKKVLEDAVKCSTGELTGAPKSCGTNGC